MARRHQNGRLFQRYIARRRQKTHASARRRNKGINAAIAARAGIRTSRTSLIINTNQGVDTMTACILSEQARTALQGALTTKGPHKGQFLARAPRSNTLAYAAWHGAMLSINPYKVSIGGIMFMDLEQRKIQAEITAFFDAVPKNVRINFDRDRLALERLGVWYHCSPRPFRRSSTAISPKTRGLK